MSSYQEVFNNICRLCLSDSKSDNMVSLIYNTKDLSHFGKAVITFANISIQPDDNYPKKMCLNCLHLLKQAIIFKLKCEASEKQLHRLVNGVNIGSENFKEKIVQYSMFQLYFPKENTHKLHNKHHNVSQKLSENENNAQLMAKKKVNFSHSKVKKIDNINESAHVVASYDTFCDQNPESECEIGPKYVDTDEKILDILETMTGSHPEMLDDDFKHCKKGKLLRLKKLFKRKRKRVQENNKYKRTSLVCKVCRKVLANQHTYKHHMQRHNGCRYICEYCGKGFPVSTELNIHRVAQHGTGSYLQCQHCSFKAPRKFDLIEHERIHTGERPYACDKCGLTFRRRGIWRKHLIYHMEKKVQCTQCPRKFYLRSEMLAHANNVHERIYVYMCNICGVTYARPVTVRRHLIEKHGIPREIQGKVIRVNKGSCLKQSL